MVEKRFEKLGMPDIERFENYLPTAFNSELTLLQKVNKIIFDLIETNKLTNEMVDYLNQFIEKFDEKLYETIDDILSKWLEDGILTELIRNTINEEVVEARNDYSTLKERLDSEKTEVTEQLAQIVTNVKNFGALGDGVTDDIVAFKAARNYVKTNGGGTILVPHTTTGYVLSESFCIDGDNITLDLQGNTITFVDGGVYDTSGGGLVIGRLSSDVDQSIIKNSKIINGKVIYLKKDGAVPTRPFMIRKGEKCLIDQCWSEKANDSAFVIDYGRLNKITNCYAKDPGFHTYYLLHGAYDCTFSFNHSQNVLVGHAYNIGQSPDFTDKPNFVTHNTADNVNQFVKGQDASCHVIDNTVSNSLSENWKVVVSHKKNVVVKNNRFYECKSIFTISNGDNAVIEDNICVNLTNTMTPMVKLATNNIKNLSFRNNYFYSEAPEPNFIIWTETTPLTGLYNNRINDNTFIIKATTTTGNYAVRLNGYDNSEFSRNKIVCPHNWAIFGAGEFTTVDDNDITGGLNELAIQWTSGNNTFRNNTARNGCKYRFNVATDFYTGNKGGWHTSTPENNRPQSYGGNPNTFVTPRFLGDECLDTLNSKFYKAKGLLNTDWVLLN